MFRKIIYIGEFDNQAIYFDIEKQVPLAASKSSLLNTQKSKYSWKYIVCIILILSLIRIMCRIFPVLDPFHVKYSNYSLFDNSLGGSWGWFSNHNGENFI